MKIITLPLVDDTLPAWEGVRTFRSNRVKGLLATDGMQYWLHEYDPVANALHRNRSVLLGQLPRKEVPVLTTAEAAAEGLNFVQPHAQTFQAFFNRRGTDMVVIGVHDGNTGSRMATLVTRFDSGYLGAVYSAAWVCPKNSQEIWEDADKPADGLCPTHRVALKEEV
jgi:hypothetical protein